MVTLVCFPARGYPGPLTRFSMSPAILEKIFMVALVSFFFSRIVTFPFRDPHPFSLFAAPYSGFD